jgi:tripartite-type tricarboxylate transporter receptor subunit TctC
MEPCIPGRSMKKLTIAALTCLTWLAATGAQAQYPDRPIRFVVPQAPGSASDTVARILASELTREMGQPIVVDNRPGGALVIGMEIIAKSPPDGYTIGLGPVGAMAISRNMVAKLPYDVDRDFQPIAQVTSGNLMVAVAPTLPVKSVKELIDYAKANPGKVMNGSSGNGTPGHVSAELFKSMSGTQIVHVPYKGGAAAINDLMAGHIHLMFESLNGIASFARSGKVRAIAVTGATRSAAYPDIPTLAEAGVPGYEATTWSGVIGPAGLPRPILDKLNAGINRSIAAPSLKEKFAFIGDDLVGGTPEEFGAFIKKENAKWAEVIRRSGAKIE